MHCTTHRRVMQCPTYLLPIMACSCLRGAAAATTTVRDRPEEFNPPFEGPTTVGFLERQFAFSLLFDVVLPRPTFWFGMNAEARIRRRDLSAANRTFPIWRHEHRSLCGCPMTPQLNPWDSDFPPHPCRCHHQHAPAALRFVVEKAASGFRRTWKREPTLEPPAYALRVGNIGAKPENQQPISGPKRGWASASAWLRDLSQTV
jgi:hypothetical protein